MFRNGLIAAAALLAGSSGVAHAGFIQTTFTDGLTTQVENATVYDFDTGAKPAGYSGDGWILPSSVSGMAAAPAGDPTPFLSVAFPKAAGVETFNAAPGDYFNYFGLYWGSIDDYNVLRFFDGGTLLGTVTGLDVIQAGTALGNQTAAGSNRYVNLRLHDMWFNRIELLTTQFAFESDNHAFAKVPEPGTLALMGAGLLAFVYLRRRRYAEARAAMAM